MSFQNTDAPKSRPVIKQDFTNGQGLGGDWYYSRLSAATYTDKNGFIVAAGVNEPRFEHDPNPYTVSGYPCKGLLIESVTNNFAKGNILNSYETDGGPWASGENSVLYTDQDVEPPSAYDAAVSFIATSGGNGITALNTNGTYPANTTTVWSCFVKQDPNNGVPKVRLNMQNFGGYQQGGGAGAIFTLTGEGVAVPDYVDNNGNVGIQAYPNGWYRIFVVGTLNSNINVRGRILVVNADDTSLLQDLSQPQASLSGVYVWAPQLETYEAGTDVMRDYNRIMYQPASVIFTESGVTQTNKERDIVGLFGDSVTNAINPNTFTALTSVRDPSINPEENTFARVLMLRSIPQPFNDFTANQDNTCQIFINWDTGDGNDVLFTNNFRESVSTSTMGLGQTSTYFQRGYNNSRIAIGFSASFDSDIGTIPADTAAFSYTPQEQETATWRMPSGDLNQIFIGAAGNSRYVQGCYEFLEVYNEKYTTDQLDSIVEYKHVDEALL